jgi:hypothetical protein
MHRATARSRLIGFDLPSHTILLMLLMRVIIAMEVKPRIALTAGALNSMCVERRLVLEERVKLQLNLPITISFGARRK